MDEKPVRRNSVDHMANERTFLAWIRTSIGLMAFGFVIERFVLFMKQLTFLFSQQGIQKPADIHTGLHQTYSSISGIALVVLGTLIGFLAFIKYRQVEKQIDEDSYQSSMTLAIVLTVVIIVTGIFLVVYLANS